MDQKRPRRCLEVEMSEDILVPSLTSATSCLKVAAKVAVLELSSDVVVKEVRKCPTLYEIAL